MLLMLKGTSTLNQGILGKIDLFAYFVYQQQKLYHIEEKIVET